MLTWLLENWNTKYKWNCFLLTSKVPPWHTYVNWQDMSLWEKQNGTVKIILNNRLRMETNKLVNFINTDIYTYSVSIISNFVKKIFHVTRSFFLIDSCFLMRVVSCHRCFANFVQYSARLLFLVFSYCATCMREAWTCLKGQMYCAVKHHHSSWAGKHFFNCELFK